MRWTHRGRWCAVSPGTLNTSRLCRYTRPRHLAMWGRGTWTFPVSYVNLNALFQRKTLQTTEARIVSGFGWGLTRQIENYGLARFRKNVQRVRPFTRPMVVSQVFLQSREGVTLILDLIRQSRRQPMPVGSSYLSPTSASRSTAACHSFDRHGPESHQIPGPDDLPHRG